MRLAGVTKDSQPPAGGQIIRDADGNPTGVFIDRAMALVGRAVRGPTRLDVRGRLLAAQDLALHAGLTGVHDAGISPQTAEVYRDLDREGKLRIRIYAMASGGDVGLVGRSPQAGPDGALFEMRSIKLFIDGAMGSRGGLLFESYHDDPGNKGLMLIEPNLLESTTTAALRHGWQVATHAIGDRGNALVLDAYAAARKAVPEARDPRLRIEHAQVVRKDDVRRFAELGVIASMQPSHASTDMRWADARLGPERVGGAYAWRWFVDARVPLAFGSDFPVEVVNPFWGIYAAITRQDAEGRPEGGWHPEHRLTLEEALRGHTAGSAYAAFAEDRVGILKPGLRADVTIVDRDLFRVTPKELLAARVVMTIVERPGRLRAGKAVIAARTARAFTPDGFHPRVTRLRMAGGRERGSGRRRILTRPSRLSCKTSTVTLPISVNPSIVAKSRLQAKWSRQWSFRGWNNRTSRPVSGLTAMVLYDLKLLHPWQETRGS